MPPNERSRPGQGAAPEVETPGKGIDNNSVGHSAGTVTPLRRYPVAYASLYAPAGRRRMWWFAYVCPRCGAGHFGRVANETAVTGVRRSGCGRLIWLVVARTYRGRQVEAVSA